MTSVSGEPSTASNPVIRADDEFCYENGQSYRPFKNPQRIMSNDKKKKRGVDPRLDIKGIPPGHLGVFDFKGELGLKPKKTPERQPQQDVGDMAQEVPATTKSEDDYDSNSSVSDSSSESSSPSSDIYSSANVELFPPLHLPFVTSAETSPSHDSSFPHCCCCSHDGQLSPQTITPCDNAARYSDFFQRSSTKVPFYSDEWSRHEENGTMMEELGSYPQDLPSTMPDVPYNWILAVPQVEENFLQYGPLQEGHIQHEHTAIGTLQESDSIVTNTEHYIAHSFNNGMQSVGELLVPMASDLFRSKSTCLRPGADGNAFLYSCQPSFDDEMTTESWPSAWPLLT